VIFSRWAATLAATALASTAIAAPALAAAAPLTVANLQNATITVPPMAASGCPHGALKFSKGYYRVPHSATSLHLQQAVAFNADTDKPLETGLLISCDFGEAGPAEVIAVDRGAGGSVQTLGWVAGPDRNIREVWEMKAAKGGDLLLKTGDYLQTSARDHVAQQQWRGYGYRKAGGFQQVSGPTAFPTRHSATDLKVKTSAPHFGKRGNGSITITVANKGSKEAYGSWLHFETLGGITVTGALQKGCFREPKLRGYACEGIRLQPGKKLVYTVALHRAKPGTLLADVTLLPNHDDLKPKNNAVRVTVT